MRLLAKILQTFRPSRLSYNPITRQLPTIKCLQNFSKAYSLNAQNFNKTQFCGRQSGYSRYTNRAFASLSQRGFVHNNNANNSTTFRSITANGTTSNPNTYVNNLLYKRFYGSNVLLKTQFIDTFNATRFYSSKGGKKGKKNDDCAEEKAPDTMKCTGDGKGGTCYQQKIPKKRFTIKREDNPKGCFETFEEECPKPKCQQAKFTCVSPRPEDEPKRKKPKKAKKVKKVKKVKKEKKRSTSCWYPKPDDKCKRKKKGKKGKKGKKDKKSKK